ncbi:amidohydrolase family protein [Streptomyces sp. NPDC056844]|uniref:amidohydrolase family protein n=1 Tax=unclassified Streptomyces TaxID=2593676 RepID=UPI00368A3859
MTPCPGISAYCGSAFDLERFPGVEVLLDHIGYPDIAASPARAGAEVAELGVHPGLHCKITHRNLERLQDAGDAAGDFLTPVVEAFGAGRIAWGSNCPAAEQSLPELLALAEDVLATRSSQARHDACTCSWANTLTRMTSVSVPASVLTFTEEEGGRGGQRKHRCRNAAEGVGPPLQPCVRGTAIPIAVGEHRAWHTTD